MGRLCQFHLLLRKDQRELIPAFPQPVHVGSALCKIHRGKAISLVTQTQRAERECCIRSNPQRAAILKLNLGAPIRARAQLRSLCDRKIEKGILKTQSRILVDLDPALTIDQRDEMSLPLQV